MCPRLGEQEASNSETQMSTDKKMSPKSLFLLAIGPGQEQPNRTENLNIPDFGPSQAVMSLLKPTPAGRVP